jgi:hypothetical protein
MPSLQNKCQEISMAQAVYFDLIYGKTPAFDKGYDRQTKERWLRNNLYAAFKSTDRYVWFYNERANWWNKAIDSGVAVIIRSVKNQINKELQNRSNVIKGKSSMLFLNRLSDVTESESINNTGFYYTFSKMKKALQLTFLNTKNNDLQIFQNSALIYEAQNPSKTTLINLLGKYNNGNLIILSKDNNGKVSIAYVN